MWVSWHSYYLELSGLLDLDVCYFSRLGNFPAIISSHVLLPLSLSLFSFVSVSLPLVLSLSLFLSPLSVSRPSLSVSVSTSLSHTNVSRSGEELQYWELLFNPHELLFQLEIVLVKEHQKCTKA